MHNDLNHKMRNARLFLRWAALIAVAALLTACAGGMSLRRAAPPADLQWPPKPDKAKIQWVKSIADAQEAGVAKSFWKKAAELFSGPDDRRMVRPYGVLVDQAERLFIADPGAGVVHLMDVKKRRYIRIGDDPIRPMRTPIGLAEDDHGRLFITDSTKGMVYSYDIAGGTLKPFLLSSKLQRPTGIAYSRVNRLLYIVDTTAHQVVAVDGGGVEKFRIGAPGEEEGGFNHPTDIWIDAAGKVYVTDPLNYKIKVFTPDGKLLNQIGIAGDAPGYLNKPKGVAVDSEGHIYVIDALLDAVQVFDDSGRLLLSFGATGSRDGEFWLPSGIFIDQRNLIYVADSYNRRIQVFRYLPGAGAGAGDKPDAPPPATRTKP